MIQKFVTNYHFRLSRATKNWQYLSDLSDGTQQRIQMCMVTHGENGKQSSRINIEEYVKYKFLEHKNLHW